MQRYLVYVCARITIGSVVLNMYTLFLAILINWHHVQLAIVKVQSASSHTL